MSKSARLAEMFEFEDEESQRQALCERCRKFVLMSNIKYVPKGNDSKMALCNKCLKNFTPPPSNLKKGDFEEDNQVKYTRDADRVRATGRTLRRDDRPGPGHPVRHAHRRGPSR